MKERLTGERFVPEEHAYLPTNEEMLQMGVRSLTRLHELEGIQGPTYYTQLFEQEVEFEDGWRYTLLHTKIPREQQVTDITAQFMTPWTIGLRGFIPHNMHTVGKFGQEATAVSVPINLDRGAGNYEANSRNYARVTRLAATVLGERDKDHGITIGDSRAANYGIGVAAFGPEHGYDSLYNDLRVASQINGVPEVKELKEMYYGLSPEKVYEKICNGEVPLHLNPVWLSKLPFRIFKRLWTTFSPEIVEPVRNLITEPIKMIAEGESLQAAYEKQANKFRLDTIDLPLNAIKHYPSSIDIRPRGAYRQMMEFLPLTDGSFGWTVRNVLRRSQFQYLSGREKDGLSIFPDVVKALNPDEFPNTITNMLKGTHKDIITKSDHTDRVQRLGKVIIPMLAEHGAKLKTMEPAPRAQFMHHLAAIALPDVYKGTTSDVPEDYSRAA